MKPESETKCRLLQTALELIWENSYGSVSVDDICRRAGIRKGSFYHFFPSKSDLTVAAMEASWQQRRPVLDEVFSPQVPALERLERYCHQSYISQSEKQKQFGKICGCPHITLGAELSTQDEKIRLKSVEIMSRYIRYFESALRDAATDGVIELENPRKKAEELFAYCQGLLLQAKLLNTLEPLSQTKKGLFQLLGILQREAIA